MTQLSNVLITDNSTYYQNKLSVIKTSDNCVFSKADLRAINISHFKAFGMTNLQYEIRIPQKIYKRATIHYCNLSRFL